MLATRWSSRRADHALRRRIEEMVRDLASAARTDLADGLLNRRGFEEAFELELERARRTGHTLSVLIGDLDRFKQVNDRFGHYAGDRALARASEILDAEKRRIDTVARLGGEEFALIVPDTDDHHAFMLAERLRTALQGSVRGRASFRSRSASASRASPATASLRRSCWARPTTRCTPPRSSAATALSYTAARSRAS